MGNILWGGVDLRDVEHVGEAIIATEDCRVTHGDILFNTRNTPLLVGKTAFWHAPFEAAIDNNIMRIRLRAETDSAFVARWMGSNFGRKAIGRFVCASTSVGAVYWRDLRKLKLPLPPLSEQRRITEILSTWDRAIERVEALIANARIQKQALMQQLLSGKHRLPGFSGEWQRKPINEIVTRVTRRNDGTELPVLTISSTSGFVRQDEKYSRFMAGKSVETYIMLNEGEFAYNKGNSKTYEFGCIFDLEGYERALVPHVYVCFKLKKGYSHRFYKALFEADYLAPQLGRLVNTGVRNNGLLNIKPSEFLGTKVPVPPLDEQDAIAAVMEAASRTVIEHEAQLTALRKEKAALMQQLLTGKRRVKLPESEVA
ncbi:restriction endonuclease subunit S [Croceicoccus pelagius]|nr:restriction endonuclease subunit S [Croceicoccus pelagius]